MTYCIPVSYTHLTNPETVESWFSRREYLTDLGVDGFKTDGGEFILSDGARFFDGTTGAEGRNLYPQMYTRAYTEHLLSLIHI